ncbi:MAG: response regulator transcription factor [Spirochaetales bacterium]|nr:response regulator transcription factor [Spirochaetales bacterium]
MEKKLILVIEDNGRLRRYVCSNLKKAGYSVLEADSEKAAYSLLKQQYPDLILLDLRLGDYDGIEILRTIRKQEEYLPIIIVSSIDNQDIKVDGFNIGCDDYITKPFYIEELLGRVKRLLKRSAHQNEERSAISEVIKSGPFSLDINLLSVTKNGDPIVMRKKLFDLFLFFVRHPGMVVSYELLYNRIWDSLDDRKEGSLYVHIRHLRSLIEDNPSRPHYIKTIKNVGYVYSPGIRNSR